SAVQPEAVAARLVAGGDRRVGREAKALLGLGNFLTQLVQVPRRQRAVARLLGRLRGAGQQPFVPAEFQGDVQCPGRGRGRGHVWFSVCKDTGVLPDGDLYHRRYLAAYMVSNDRAHLPGRPESRNGTKRRHAGPAGAGTWFGATPHTGAANSSNARSNALITRWRLGSLRSRSGSRSNRV